jgi:predicted phage-related endonuclease
MTRVRIFPSDRPTGLGASELASIAGLSPWRTPLDTWLSKVEETEPPEPAEHQQLGLDLEGFLVHSIPGAKRNSVTHSHPDWPIVRLFATPDGIADRGHTLIEAKSVTHGLSDWSDGAIPEQYVIQAYGQMACYPWARRVKFAVLLGGRPAYRELGRPDTAVLDELVESAMRWWATYVVRGIVPPPMTDEDRWTIARRDSIGDRMTRLATPDEQAAADDLLEVRARIGELEAQEKEVRLRLAELASGADIAGAGFKATWSTRIQRDYRAAWIADKRTAVLPDEHVLESRVFTVRSVKETAE